MAARRLAQPLYAVYLEWVINIQAVQRHRAAVTDPYTAEFFSEGCRPGRYGDFQWSLDDPVASPWGVFASAINPVSPPLQHAWNAAVVAFVAFIAALVHGELIASGVHPTTGARCEIDPAEWTRTGLILDVRNGDLFEWGQIEHMRREGRSIKHLRWSSITLRAVKQPRQKKARGHGYDWEGAWTFATTLRAEDQWDWKKYRRDKKPLPAVRKVVEDKIKKWFEAKGSVPDIRDIRQNITIPLYAGRRTRGKRKR